MADLSHLYTGDYDTDKAAESATTNFAPVPKGTYRVKVTKAELTKTKAGDGEMVKIRLDILGPTNAGRVIFDDILIVHPKEEAQSIGRTRMATLSRACALRNPKNTELLVGKEVDAFIKVETDAQYGDKNKVSFYSTPANGALNGATGASAGFNDDDVPF